MHHAARLLLGLAALTAAGAVLAHTGVHPHAHPHPDLDLYLFLVAAVGAGLGVLFVGRNKRPPK